MLTLYEYTTKENWYEFAALEDHLCWVVEVTQGAVRQPHGRHSQECNEYVGFYRYTETKPKHNVDIFKVFSVAMFYNLQSAWPGVTLFLDNVGYLIGNMFHALLCRPCMKSSLIF